MDQSWSENESGICLLGTVAPGKLIELEEATPDWVLSPFTDIRFHAYLALREPANAEIRAWRALRTANHGVAANKWNDLRKARAVWYTIPPSVDSDRMWLRHEDEAAFVATMGAFLRGRRNATMGSAPKVNWAKWPVLRKSAGRSEVQVHQGRLRLLATLRVHEDQVSNLGCKATSVPHLS